MSMLSHITDPYTVTDFQFIFCTFFLITTCNLRYLVWLCVPSSRSLWTFEHADCFSTTQLDIAMALKDKRIWRQK